MAVDTRSLDYRPVNIAKGEIRLLEINAAHEFDAPIVGRLINVKAADDTEYVGLCALLRYSDETNSEDIWINGCKISVPTTISEALRNVRALFLRDQGSLYRTRSQHSSSAVAPPAGPRQRKSPGWLKHLLRGFKTILPDDHATTHSRNVPLRVFLDSICMNGRNEREADQRRGHLTLAYGQAKITMGWLGPRDETTDTAIHILNQFDEVCSDEYGSSEDRLQHPEDYAPVMKLLEGLAKEIKQAGDAAGGDLTNSAMFVSWTGLLTRPFFNRAWIVEELSLSKFPAFLLGDHIISWLQFLKWNMVNEEFEKGGCQYIPQEYQQTIASTVAKLDISIVHTLLDELDKRRGKSETRCLDFTKTSIDTAARARSTTSTSTGTADKPIEKQAGSREPRHAAHAPPKFEV